MVHEAVQHKLKQVVQKTGVKKIRVHDIRHSHAAFLINKGVQPLMIKERFGHTDIRITLNTYVNPRQVDYSRDSSREQQRIGENSWENGGIYGTEK